MPQPALDHRVTDSHAESADLVVAALVSDPQRGLAEIEARARLQRQGLNELRGLPPQPRWRKLLAQFADPLVLLLLAAVVISLAVWLIEGAHSIPFETNAIVTIVLLNDDPRLLARREGRGCRGGPQADDYDDGSRYARRPTASDPVERPRRGRHRPA